MKNLKYAIGTIVELAGVVTLAVAAIKSENERQKAEKELRDANIELAGEKIKNVLYQVENMKLKNQLKKEKENEVEA